MPRYNHAYDFAFEVISNHPEGEDVTVAMLITACRDRLNRIEVVNNGFEILEVCNWFDIHEVGK